jgi:hypothetical protein
VPTNNLRAVLYVCAVAVFTVARGTLYADDSAETRQQLEQLQQQNQALQDQLRRQQALIESLTEKVNAIQQASSRAANLETEDPGGNAAASKAPSGFSLGKVSISGEGGVGIFHSGSQGIFPNNEFRVDEAKLFVEAPIWGDVYFYSELNLMTREALDLNLTLGELYLDFENVSKLWGRDRMLNVRVGRMDIPFGEEYLTRDVVDNPLISRSLSDLWGVDEGLELYGSLGKFSYVVAVQNGGASGVRDFNADKSVAGRVSYDPLRWLHLSVSGMRTGELTAPDDSWSELWFGSAWFMPFGSSDTTRFRANLVEGDVAVKLPHGQLRAFGGYIEYSDNDPHANNRRDMYYYAVETTHDITRKLYAAARFSQIFADQGYPIGGNGNPSDYVFSGVLTEQIWRLSLGLGYRWSQNLAVKAEYSFENGKTTSGASRDHEDLFAIEAVFKF